MGIALQLSRLQLPQLSAIGQIVAQPLQPLPFLLMLARLALQLTAAGFEPCQLCLDGQQLIFP